MVAEHSRATSEPVERIISVLWLLFRHPEGLTRDQLKRLIVGYEDLSAELFDKRWRWDRDALAEVGVEVIEDRGEGGLRYRVDAEHLVLPELDFTPAEHHALLLARELLDDDRLRRDAHAAVALLTPAGAQVDPDRLARLPRTPPRSVPGLREFTRAAVEQSTVSFGYRDAHAHSSRRTVRVWAVFQSRGQWYVHGWDLDRSARRTFRLSRIAGAPVPSPRTGAPERPADVDPAALRAQAAPEGTVPALTVHLAPGRAQAVRARSHRRGGDPHHLPGAWSEDAAKTAPAWERWELPQTPLSEALELLGSCLGSALPSAEHPDVHAALAEHWQRALDAHRGDPTANDRAALRGLAAPKRTRRRLSTVDHVSRLLDIVGLANRTGGITRAELRDRFDLSESELDRDLALLPYCGMPERFYAGDQFDVHDDGTTVRITGAGELYGPLRLTRPEAQRLEAALQLLGQVPSVAAADRAAAATARQRLNTALGVAESHGESPRHAESRRHGEPAVAAAWDLEVASEVLDTLATAIAEGQVLEFDYHAVHRDRHSRRRIVAWQLVREHGHLYLHAWCLDAGEARVFRVDRMAGLQRATVAAPPESMNRKTELTSVRPETQGEDVVLRFAHRVRDLAEAYAPSATAEGVQGSLIARIALHDPAVALTLVGAHGGDVVILEPSAIRESAVQSLSAAQAALSDGPAPVG